MWYLEQIGRPSHLNGSYRLLRARLSLFYPHSSHALQLFQQHFSLPLGWCFSVPLGVVCHVTYTVSFDCIGNYHHRLVMHLSSLVKSVHHLFDPVTIYLKDLPVKCSPLVLCGIKWHNVFSKAVLLDAVTIQNGD